MYILFSIPAYLNAQQAGVVLYQESITLNLPEHIRSRLGSELPESVENAKVLAFHGSRANYNSPEVDEKEKSFNDGEGNRTSWWMRRASNDDKNYYDYDLDLHVRSMDMMGKTFLVADSIDTYQWKISAGEQRTIQGYTCMKATTMSDTIAIEAWFTPQISVSMGPEGYSGLPGLILAVGFGENKAMVATKITLDSIPEIVPIEVTKDALTKAEFKEMSEKRREEMRKMWSGNRKRWDIRND